ncbi:MAG: gamma carbonic anhydrase family protein [Faecalibacterium sp.]
MPRDEGAVFVAANATVLGDVTLGRGVNIWYGAVLRADEGALILGENSNVQDNAVLHCDPGGQVVLGKNVTVGHSALVHGCTVGDNSLIGMHATILNHAVVGKNCIIGAGALVPEGMVIPDNSVAVGVPGPGHQDHPGRPAWPTTSRTQKPMWRWAVSTRRWALMLKISIFLPKNLTGRLTNLSQERHDFGR